MITTKHANNSPVTFVTHGSFARLLLSAVLLCKLTNNDGGRVTKEEMRGNRSVLQEVL